MRNSTNMGLLTLALTFIALGTLGPLAIGLLTLFFVAVLRSTAMLMMLASLGLVCVLIAMLAFVGQILCFFSPLSDSTKKMLGICMGIGLVNWFLSGWFSGLVGFACLIAYLFFLYGVCEDLEMPEATQSFNSAALFGLLAMATGVVSPFAAFVSPGLMLVGLVGALCFGVLAFVRYAGTIVSLAVRANQLRLEFASSAGGPGLTPLPGAAPAAQDFGHFEEAAPAMPAFEMEGSQMYDIGGELPPLHEATRLGDSEKVSYYLQAPAALHSKASHGISALHIASISGVMAVADLLLKRGVDVDEVSDGGLTALYYAIQFNNGNLVGLLLARGARLDHRNAQERTPLHWAAAVPTDKLVGQARVKMVQLLLSKGADPEARDNTQRTAAELALAAGHQDVADAISRFLTPG